MKETLVKLFVYHNHFNLKLIEEFKKHKDALPSRSYPTFCHILNASKYWHARIDGVKPVGVQDEYDVNELSSIQESIHQRSMQLIENGDLDKAYSYSNAKGQTYSTTLGDILLQLANHTTHHRGQIISDFRLSGIEPIKTDYIFFAREESETPAL